MICPSCHTQNRDNARFCKSCGLSFPAQQGGTEQPQAAPVQVPASSDQAEASVVTVPASTETNATEEDISLAPTLILTPEEMMAYHARRWQHEMEQEQVQGQQADTVPAQQQNTPDIADLPTMRMTPVAGSSIANGPANAEAPVSDSSVASGPANAETPVATSNDTESVPVTSNQAAAVTNHAAAQATASNAASSPSENAETPVIVSSTTSSSSEKEESEVNPTAQPSTDQNSQPKTADDFPTLAVGTTLLGRYEITQVLSAEEQEHVYQAIDHQGYQRCWNCGSEQNAEGDEFCIDCGAELLNVAYIMHEYAPSEHKSEESHVLAGSILDTFIDQGKTYIIELPQVAQSAFPNGVYLLAASESDAGTVRRSEPNEDSTLVLQLQRVHESVSIPSGVFIVADGLGGHDNGQVASRLAIGIIAEHIVSKLLARPLTVEKAGETAEAMDEDDIIEILKGAVEEANTVLCQKNQHDKTDMGSTLTGFMMVGDHAYIVNVGDSRTYMLRDGKLYQLTNDHSLVGQLVAGGLIEPDDVYTHPQRSQIFRSLGDKLNVQIDIFKQQVHPGDILLSCSDGLWEMVRNPQITDILTNATDPQMACRQLIEAANTNGGEDNVSAVVVFVRA